MVGVYYEDQEFEVSFCANSASGDGVSDRVRTNTYQVDTRVFPPTRVLVQSICGTYPDPVPGQPTVPLPAIPTPEAVFAAANLLDPEVSISPHVQGLVGLDTWLWYEGETEVSLAPIGLAGWTVTSSMRIAEYCWQMGEGQDELCATRAGSEAQPAQTHHYDRHGRYTVTVSTRWEGTYTLTHPALPAAITLPLGPGLTLTGTLPYPVIEIEAVNTATG